MRPNIDDHDYETKMKKIREFIDEGDKVKVTPVSYTHLRAHETVLDLVCRLLLEKKKQKNKDQCQ